MDNNELNHCPKICPNIIRVKYVFGPILLVKPDLSPYNFKELSIKIFQFQFYLILTKYTIPRV